MVIRKTALLLAKMYSCGWKSIWGLALPFSLHWSIANIYQIELFWSCYSVIYTVRSPPVVALQMETSSVTKIIL
jgi:hypothetical protein